MSRRFRPPVPSFDILFFCSHPKRQLCAAQERDMGGLRVSGRWLRIRCGQKQLLFFLSSSLCPSPFVVGAPWQRHIKWSVISCDNESVREVLQRLITSMDRRPPTCNENQAVSTTTGWRRSARTAIGGLCVHFCHFYWSAVSLFFFFWFCRCPPSKSLRASMDCRMVALHCGSL